MAACWNWDLGPLLMTAALKLVPSSSYFDKLCDAMALVAAEPNAIFVGQGVGARAGTTMSDTFRDVPDRQLFEMPVAEDMQMGMAIGMALEGKLPICVFPRWNFLLLAFNQLVNHLDRLPLYSGYTPKVIIRTAVPSSYPFNPGPQHDDDFTAPLKLMLRTVNVMRLSKAEMIVPAYQAAMNSERSTLLVEFTEHYKSARGQR